MFLVIKKNKLLFIISTILIAIILFASSLNIYWHYESNKAYSQHNYTILIQIEENTLYLFENGKCVKKYPIASGKPGWPSPIGYWEITSKSDWGKEFGGRWMGLNVTWGKYGIHGTTKESSIGRAASHGCIRMHNKDVKELYNIVPIGTPVIIKNGSFGPFGTGFRNLIPGDRGADVLAVQQRLKQLGYFKGKETGIYENDLKNALYNFQKDNNLKVNHTITVKVYNAMGFRLFE